MDAMLEDTFDISETPKTPNSPETKAKLSFPDFMNNNNNISFSNTRSSRSPKSPNPDIVLDSPKDADNRHDVNDKNDNDMDGPALSSSPPSKMTSLHLHNKRSPKDSNNTKTTHKSQKRDRKPSPYHMSLNAPSSSPRKSSLQDLTSIKKSGSVDYNQFPIKREWPKFLRQQSATNQRLASIVMNHTSLRRKGSCPKISAFLSLAQPQGEESAESDEKQMTNRLKSTSSIPLTKDRGLAINSILSGVLEKVKILTD